MVGKIVGNARYIHKSAQFTLCASDQERLGKCIDLVGKDFDWNVIKFDLNDNDIISLLSYTDFNVDPFPALRNSVLVCLNNGLIKRRTYSATNPPILHRKELLLASDNRRIKKFRKLTKDLDEFGAFKQIYKFGTKQRWEDRLLELGIEITDHKVLKDL